MVIQSPTEAAARPPEHSVPQPLPSDRARRYGWVLMAAILALFIPVLQSERVLWSHDDRYAHGFLIVPISLGLLWLRRTDLRRAEPGSMPSGALWIWLGVGLRLIAYFLQLPHLDLWSLLLILAGGIQLVFGPQVWRIVRFPVVFLLFAGSLPGVLLGPATHGIQSLSTVGAASVMSVFGFPLARTGNIIDIPGITLGIYGVCSGYRKLVTLLAFALLYGYVFPLVWWKRVLLAAAAPVVALLTNIARIAGLIAVGTWFSPAALHTAHEYGDYVALGLAFASFGLLGRSLGCKNPRFTF